MNIHIRSTHFIKTKSFTVICFYVGVVSLALQFIIFFTLLNYLDIDKPYYTNKIILDTNENCYQFLEEDIGKLAKIGLNLGFNFLVFDKHFLDRHKSNNKNANIIQSKCSECHCKPAVLALEYSILIEKRKQLLTKIVDEDFSPVTFFNIQPLQSVSELDHVETAMFLARKGISQIVFLHPREDNTWWFGDLRSDLTYESKLASLNLTLQNVELMDTEGTIERFEVIPQQLEKDVSVMIPKDINCFLFEIDHSKFIECNETRASLFQSKFKPDRSPEAMRFRHKVWKMLSRVKTVLDSLKIPFWLSSGTALGFFRECDIIGHSKDVDIGVWASTYTDQIVTEMHKRKFRLKISLGFPNDSLELSFVDESGIKLDIFFFYQDDDSYWNGGTQVKSGKKFKYEFPKFTLCWTLFKDLRVRIPCETEEYIRANYGPDWFVPVTTWDWKTSPFNVKPNGMWRTDQLANAIKLYAT